MITPIDPNAIAVRIRSLIGGQSREALDEAIGRLRVSEVALRMSIDDLEPHPSIEVLVAVVREYGVDPTWLLTGVYDQLSHRRAMDEPAEVSQAFAALFTSGAIHDPPSLPANETRPNELNH